MMQTYTLTSFLGRPLQPTEDPVQAVMEAIQATADSYETTPCFNCIPATNTVTITFWEDLPFSEEVMLAELAASTAFCTRYQ